MSSLLGLNGPIAQSITTSSALRSLDQNERSIMKEMKKEFDGKKVRVDDVKDKVEKALALFCLLENNKNEQRDSPLGKLPLSIGARYR